MYITQLSSGILNIPIFMLKNAFYRKGQIFLRQFLHLNSLFSWQETVENYPHRPENPFPKKKRQTDKNFESYPGILQAVSRILKCSLVIHGVLVCLNYFLVIFVSGAYSSNGLLILYSKI